jgi:hypothetical protein
VFKPQLGGGRESIQTFVEFQANVLAVVVSFEALRKLKVNRLIEFGLDESLREVDASGVPSKKYCCPGSNRGIVVFFEVPVDAPAAFVFLDCSIASSFACECPCAQKYLMAHSLGDMDNIPGVVLDEVGNFLGCSSAKFFGVRSMHDLMPSKDVGVALVAA